MLGLRSGYPVDHDIMISRSFCRHTGCWSSTRRMAQMAINAILMLYLVCESPWDQIQTVIFKCNSCKISKHCLYSPTLSYLITHSHPFHISQQGCCSSSCHSRGNGCARFEHIHARISHSRARNIYAQGTKGGTVVLAFGWVEPSKASVRVRGAY